MNTATAISHTIRSDITSTTEAAISSEVQQVVARASGGWRALDLHIETVRLIDSKGLNFLVGLVKQLRASDRVVRLIRPQPTVRRILAFTQLDRHVEIVES